MLIPVLVSWQMLIRWCLLGFVTVQDFGWSLMLQRNIHQSSGVAEFCLGICRKKGRIRCSPRRYNFIPEATLPYLCHYKLGLLFFTFHCHLLVPGKGSYICNGTVYFSHFWLCETMTRASKYFSFSALLFCTPSGLDRDLSTLFCHVFEWPSCLQPAYRINPVPFPNYKCLSNYNFVTKDGAAHSSEMLVSLYSPKWWQNPKTIRWSSVPLLNL